MLDVGDGQRLYWETCGNRDGKPAVVLHGGPGSGCTPGTRRSFDPQVYRVVLWLAEGQLLREAHRLAGIPAVLIHGRLDLGCPLQAAWELAQAWPSSGIVVLDSAGHTSSELGDHIVAATDRFARS